MLAIITTVLRGQLRTAWSSWTAYVSQKQQHKNDLQEVTLLGGPEVLKLSVLPWHAIDLLK